MFLSSLWLIAIASLSVAQAQEQQATYGVDVSWPMHHAPVSTNFPWLPHNQDPSLPVPDRYKGMVPQPLGDVKARYDAYMQGCFDYYEKRRGKGQRCIETEEQRIQMTKRQPSSMVNYTAEGFKKIRAPEPVFVLLKEFWEKNKDKKKPESWTTGNIYTNHWESPSYMVSVEDTELVGAGFVLKQHVWNAARDTIEEWTGHKQVECSLYGIRVYTTGAMLAPHVDRNPLVSSAIINVDQDVDEPWPLEVIGHDGIARNVTMEPGDLVLYESHSIIHGRQFPLKGRFMANVFIHFEPVGPVGGPVEYDGDFPPYVVRGSPEEIVWRRNNPNGHEISKAFTTGSTDAHILAATDDHDALAKYLDEHEQVVTQRDVNGWTPLAEAVRQGNEEIVRLLLERGSEVNARIGTNEDGGSILYLAKEALGEEDPVVLLLQTYGARLIPPGPSQGEL